MKTYLKIFAITASIQLVGFVLAKLVDELLRNYKTSTIVPFYVGSAFVLISIILGIILPLYWCDTKLKKVLTIFLLPTNYTWLIAIISVILFVRNILNGLGNLPDNFG